MMHGHRIIGSISAAFIILFVSCVSIPNEGNVNRSNMSVEYTTLGDGYYEQKNYTKAITYYKKAIDSDETNQVASYKLACSYALSEHWTEALVIYSELLEKDSANRTLQESVAYVTVMSGDFINGVALYERLVTSFPTDGKLLKNFILTLIAAEKSDEAKYQLSMYKVQFGEDDTTDVLSSKLNETTLVTEESSKSESDIESTSTKSKDTSIMPAKNNETADKKAQEDKTSVPSGIIIPDWTKD